MAIERVSSLNQLEPALSKGVRVAAYEAPILGLNAKALSTLGRHRGVVSGSLGKILSASYYEPKNLKSKIDSEVRFIGESFGAPAGDTFREIAHDHMATVRSLPSYKARHPNISFGHPKEAVSGWHTDDEELQGESWKKLRMIRIYNGPSTEYARNKSGEGREVIKDSAIVLHTTGSKGSVHRAPERLDSNRFIIASWLDKRA